MEFNLFNTKFFIKKDILAVIILSFVAIMGFIGYIIVKEQANTVVLKPHENVDAINSLNKEVTNEHNTTLLIENEKPDLDEIKVYVTGCVNKPGIISLNKGQIINDAIIAAGGATSHADIDNINLVYKLHENVMIHIRSKDETKVSSEQGAGGTGVVLTLDSGGAIVQEESSQENTGGKVNINRATASQLTTLPGVGEATAKDIIEYREKHGGFKTIEDIMKVPRIKKPGLAVSRI